METPDIGHVLYTIGYGSSKPEDFLARLKDAGIAVVLDLRRERSKSWCGKYRHGHAMRSLVATQGIEYWPVPYWGNDFDTLDAYKTWLDSREMREEAELLAAIIEDDYAGKTLCLLCSESKAYRGGKVNCHRVYVADALKKILGQGWEVEHIA